MNNQQYNEYIEKHSSPSTCVLNCIKAFFVGGIIALIGEILATVYQGYGIDKENALLLASISIIFLSGLLTGIGIFDKIAKFGGAGALVPISGFSNSITSQAIESKSEGIVLGIGAKIFTIAGPVIVYGSCASIIYGVIYYLLNM